MSNFEINEIKKKVYEFIGTGCVDSKLIDALTYEGRLIQKESDFWDYKQGIPGNPADSGKLIKQIISFYNSYGGYLIFGVQEKQGHCEISGIEDNQIEEKAIRSKIRSYCGTEVDITYNELKNERKLTVGILYIPKRPPNERPLSFVKNGPNDKKNKRIFSIDETFFRSRDECRIAKSADDWEFLSSPRISQWDDKGIYKIPNSQPLTNNLPDSSLICSNFVGRDKIIASLWQWLTDPFAYCKTLAGDGGKGKTSIAYEFCKDFCKTKPYGFEQLIWLTGKRAQFRPLKNSYENLPSTNFSSYSSLLDSICEELGMLDEEFKETSETHIKSLLRNHLSQLPSLIVLDDIDSLDPSDQRRSMELAMQVAQGTNSKFLLTTRMNLFFSPDMCITVSGLSKQEFKDLINFMAGKFSIKVKSEQIEKIYKATLGSPLFLESIFRLVNTGENLDNATNRWKGEDGEQAREAALLREIEQLSTEAKRCLLALSHVTSASAIEVRQITGYQSIVFDRAVEELRSLFLIESPSYIESEPRFEVPSTTSSLVISNKEKLVTDYNAIEKSVKQARENGNATKSPSKRNGVGLAINQAFALIKEDRADEALETIKSALSSTKGNPDLTLALARIKLQHFPKLLNEARKEFRASYNSGQRKQMLYDLWFDAEYQAGHPQGMIEVSKLAIDSEPNPSADWFYKKSLGEWLLAQSLIRARNYAGSLSQIKQAQKDVNTAIKASRKGSNQDLIEISKQLTDEAWKVAVSIDTKDGWIDALDIAQTAIKFGDIRQCNFDRSQSSLEKLVNDGFSKSSSGKAFITHNLEKLQDKLELKRDGKYAWTHQDLAAFDQRIEELKEHL